MGRPSGCGLARAPSRGRSALSARSRSKRGRGPESGCRSRPDCGRCFPVRRGAEGPLAKPGRGPLRGWNGRRSGRSCGVLGRSNCSSAGRISSLFLPEKPPSAGPGRFSPTRCGPRSPLGLGRNSPGGRRSLLRNRSGRAPPRPAAALRSNRGGRDPRSGLLVHAGRLPSRGGPAVKGRGLAGGPPKGRAEASRRGSRPSKRAPGRNSLRGGVRNWPRGGPLSARPGARFVVRFGVRSGPDSGRRNGVRSALASPLRFGLQCGFTVGNCASAAALRLRASRALGL